MFASLGFSPEADVESHSENTVELEGGIRGPGQEDLRTSPSQSNISLDLRWGIRGADLGELIN